MKGVMISVIFDGLAMLTVFCYGPVLKSKCDYLQIL